MTDQPTAADVAAMYDHFTDLLEHALGGNIHLGYWDDTQDTAPIGQATDRLTRLVAERLAPAAGDRVLDLGCGTGKPAVDIAAASGARITGITVSAHQLDGARQRTPLPVGRGSATFELADATALAFEDASFDGAYAIESILHIQDKKTALAHVTRTLRPGGRLVVADIFRKGQSTAAEAELIEQVTGLFQMTVIPTQATWHTLIGQAGLKLTEFTDIADHVRRGFDSVVALFRDTAQAQGGHTADELTSAADLVERFSRLPQLGYVLLTADRP
ncbi:cyclopropane-fatty-acyl-phospholipid synthase family protein [Streptacidiphilus sp. EB103A]|jgi:ubiquinone/menaquinone biosynthesis C-methylase UbiE|uniref:SAM-dependent methyltransferase n=1 Tax=Streptacidiphilus sp. EB103A TaxID=3156275 RepID=UPI0035177704